MIWMTEMENIVMNLTGCDRQIANTVDRGVLEKEDELRWLYPNMTDEEIADKLARISAQAQTNTDQALERILAGQ